MPGFYSGVSRRRNAYTRRRPRVDVSRRGLSTATTRPQTNTEALPAYAFTDPFPPPPYQVPRSSKAYFFKRSFII